MQFSTAHLSVLLASICSFLLESCVSVPPAAPYARSSAPVGFEAQSPTSLALDAQSRIYFSDQGLFSIVRIDDFSGSGLVSYGQKGYGGAGSFRGLEGDIAVDGEGRIYVIDTRAAKLVRFDDMTGSGWIELDTAALGLPVPEGLAVDVAGRIYIGDSYRGLIARVDSMQGNGLIRFGEKGSGVGQFLDPRGIAIDASGRIVIVDNVNDRLVRIDDMSGANWISYDGADRDGKGGFSEPARVILAPDQSLYVTDPTLGRVYHFDDMTGAGRQIWGWDGSGARPMQCIGIGLDQSGHIVLVDSQGKRVLRIDDMSGRGLISFPPHGPQP